MTITAAHLTWLRRVVRQTIGQRRVDTDDAFQNGYLGLHAAARAFDESRGVPFEAFAAPRVRGAIIDGWRRERWSRTVRKYLRVWQAHPGASDAELAALTGESVVCWRARRAHFDRLAALVGDRPDAILVGTCVVPSEAPVPDVLALQHLRAALGRLPQRERQIAIWRTLGHTIPTIARRYGISPARVQQLHQRALARLRVSLLPC
jgi:RNA polymerase sigma factor for flagellar operon FliA